MLSKLVILSAVVLALAPSAGPSRTVVLGPLDAAYDPAEMTVEQFEGGVVLDSVRPWNRTAAYVEVSDAAPCSTDAMQEALGDRGETRHEIGTRQLDSGLTLHWATSWTGCRALTGRPIAACIRHDGVTTRVRGLDLGCRTPIAQDALILDLLSGARPRESVG